MPIRLRKFIGMVTLVTWIVIYAAIGMTIGAVVVANAGGLVQIVFFVITGALWIFPAGLIIRWMENGYFIKPKKKPDETE